jgi:hypothetical protein
MTSTTSAPTLPFNEKVGKTCNDANRAWCEANGDTSNPEWEHVEDWRRSFVLEAVNSVLTGASPEQVHDLWRTHKSAAGWSYAVSTDDAAKTSSNMVPYADLSDFTKKKNQLFVAAAKAVGCGVERWDVKTLTDADAGKVNLTPVISTIVELLSLTAPVQPTSRVYPEEYTTYQLSGNITFAKQEADSDVHMVLTDPTDATKTMIIEAVCPTCATGSVVGNQIATVRQAVEAQFAVGQVGVPVPGTFSVPATVTGVAFFDRLHGQDGVAPNGIELHPVLAIRFH